MALFHPTAETSTFTADRRYIGKDRGCWREDQDGQLYRVYCPHPTCSTYTAIEAAWGSRFGNPEAVVTLLCAAIGRRMRRASALVQQAASTEDRWYHTGSRETLEELLDEVRELARATPRPTGREEGDRG